MMTVFIVLMLFSLYCSFKSYVSKYAIGLLAIIWTLIGLLYISMHKVASFDNYTSVKLLGSIDYNLFMFFIKPKFSLFTLKRMFNLLSVGYMSSLLFFSLSYLRLSRRQTLLSVSGVLVFGATYMLFYDPHTVYSAYLKYQYGNTMLFPVFAALDLFLWAVVIFIILIPLFVLLSQHKKVDSPYSKRQLIGICLFVLITAFIYFIIFKITNMRSLYVGSSFSRIISPSSYAFNFGQIYILLMLVFIGFLVYVFTSFNITRTGGFLKSQMDKLKMRTKNTETKKILHSVKNITLSFNILLDEALASSGDDREEKLKLLSSKINNYLSHICSFGSIDTAQSDFWQEETSARDFMDSVLEKIDFPPSITLKRMYEDTDLNIYIDAFYLSEAITNIIKNAIQTTDATGGGTITIGIKNELKWVLISITDEGAGIDKRNKKAIFRPFFTTKSMNTNWGLGLSYALDIINMHNGKISLKTKLGHGTTFFILLPKPTEKEDFHGIKNFNR